jgi:twitching motility protein PilJ
LLGIVSTAAEGDFTVTAHVTADTLGALADSFNLMVSDLSNLIRDVKMSAQHVSESTQEILEKTIEMATGAGNQAKEIVNINHLAKDMAHVAKNTDNSAQMAADAAHHTKEVAQRGGGTIDDSIISMHRIRETVLETSDRVASLGESSARIGEITEFISDIANRTNLLALNASIEATRAGKAGKGFMVVADEIRNLSERSSHAADEITRLIDDIETDTSETIMAMELGNKEVAEGTKKVDGAGSALREILGAVDISTTSVAEITNATEKQLQSSEGIVKAMEGIAKIAQRTAEVANQTETEITRLQSLSNLLNNAVSKFKLSD